MVVGVLLVPYRSLHLPISRFFDFTEELIHLTKQELQSVFHITQNLAATITSHVVDTASEWPGIVMPHFELQGMTLSELARIKQLAIVPLVSRDELQNWQEFAIENQDWIQKGVNSRLGSESRPVQDITDFVYRLNGDAVVPQNGSGVDGKYAPMW